MTKTLPWFAGETIPASDSDEETRGDDSLEGIYRQRESCVIGEILKEFGSSKSVLQCLSDELQLSHGEEPAFAHFRAGEEMLWASCT